jgi:hypothetical protein
VDVSLFRAHCPPCRAGACPSSFTPSEYCRQR